MAAETITMASERWKATHDWKIDYSMPVLATYPPRYAWECRRCGAHASASSRPGGECPGRSA